LGVHSILGKVRCSLQSLIPIFNKSVENITVPLSFEKSKKEIIQKGTISFRGILIRSHVIAGTNNNINQKDISVEKGTDKLNSNDSSDENNNNIDDKNSNSNYKELKSEDVKYIISINKIITQKLKNNEIGLDKNDVYVQLLYGNNIWNHKTSVLDEAGDKAAWEYNILVDTFMKFSIPIDNLIPSSGTSSTKGNGDLSIIVMDKNNLRSDVVIGKCIYNFAINNDINVKLNSSNKPMITLGKKSTKVMVDIYDQKGTKSGEVILYIDCETVLRIKQQQSGSSSSSSTTTPSLQRKNNDSSKDLAVFDVGTLSIYKVICNNLINIENYGSKNDPYIIFRLNGIDKKTYVIEEGGSHCIFDTTDIIYDVDRDSIELEYLSIHVYDKNNMFSDKLIGTTQTSLRFLLDKLLMNEDVIELPLTLYKDDNKNKSNSSGSHNKNDDKRNISGEVILFLHLQAVNKNSYKIDDNFKSGTIYIDRIRCHELINLHGILNNNVDNPYLKLSIIVDNNNSSSSSSSSGSSSSSNGKKSWEHITNALSIAKTEDKIPLFENIGWRVNIDRSKHCTMI